MVEQSKAVSVVAPVATGNLAETMNIGRILAQSGFFADAKQEAQAIAKILAGAELGIGPVAAMTGIYIVQGRVTLSANLMAAAIKRSGRYNYRVKKLDMTGCEVEFFDHGQSIGLSAFGPDDAKAAGLTGDNWRKYPRNMYFARAMSNGAKWFCADVFAGPVYTPDEVGAPVNPETGEIIDTTAHELTEPHNGDGPIVTEPHVAPPNTPARQRLLKRWEELWGEAALLGISDVEPLPGNADEAEITRRGQELAIRIKQAKQA